MPHLFSDVILVDPVVYSPHLPAVPEWQIKLLASAVGRRVEWPTRYALQLYYSQTSHSPVGMLLSDPSNKCHSSSNGIAKYWKHM
jgi:hypothetical protein